MKTQIKNTVTLKELKEKVTAVTQKADGVSGRTGNRSGLKVSKFFQQCLTS